MLRCNANCVQSQDSRNIPQNMRQKLRSLDIRIKADFIKQENAASLFTHLTVAAVPGIAGGNCQVDRPVSGNQSSPTKIVPGTPSTSMDDASNTSPSKRARPRSRTFTFNRGDKEGSPTKKQKSDGNNASGRVKSSEHSRSGSSKTLTSLNAADAMAIGFGSQPNVPVPQDFVAYLKEVQDPQVVEVGRVHKLRLVLRNERVAWVDSFISMGGMTEVVALLNRIMAIEWRFVLCYVVGNNNADCWL